MITHKYFVPLTVSGENVLKEVTMSNQNKTKRTKEELFLEAVKVIEQDFAGAQFDATRLAYRLDVSYRTLHDCFIVFCGNPPKEVIDRLRVTKAVELLQHGCYTQLEIAQAVGVGTNTTLRNLLRKAKIIE